MIKTVKMDFEFQRTIPGPPEAPKKLFKQSCSSDEVTIDAWRDIWLNNTKANHEKYGPFSANTFDKYFDKYHGKPCIVAGAGPGLKNALVDVLLDEDNNPVLRDGVPIPVMNLRDTKGIPIVSCLHNFHYLEDCGVDVEMYVTLDAGDVTIEEVYEGGTKSPDEYWAMTKGKRLAAFIGTSPKLLEKWQGEIVWFNCPIPSPEISAEIEALEPFSVFVSNGGNVLGACTYIAKSLLGANPIVFVGADFCFDYTKKFHPWDSKYDAKLGQVMYATDIFGNRVYTWQSYYNFKCWFDWLVCTVPGLWINATESGIMGAYSDGNIAQITQLPIRNVIEMYAMNGIMKEVIENPKSDKKIILF